MVAVKKWLQQEVDKIFSLKYRDGMSECQITQYVAENFPSHRDVKISGVRYVLRCKRPSPGTPDDPKRSQAIIANNRLQCQISNQIASPKMNLQDGIMSQKRLQEQFLRRQNRLTMSPKKIPFQSKEDLQFNPLASPLLTSFQTPNQQLQNTKDEDMTSLMNFGNLESPGFSENFFNYALPELEFEALDSSDYYSETPDNISRNSSRDSAIKKFIKNSHLYSLQGSRINELVPTPNDVNESTNIQLSIPEASQNSFLNLNSVNQSTETCGNDLTFFNQPADDILKEFSFAEQAEFQGMPGLLDTSPCQNILDMPLNTNEEKNNTNVVFDDLSPDTCFEGKQNEEQQESDCQQLASGNTGHYANLLNFLYDEIRPTATCLKEQKKQSLNEANTCSISANKFGGIKGSPIDKFQISNNSLISQLEPLINSETCENNSGNNINQSTGLVHKSNTSPMEISHNKSTINLHNPEFHEPFHLPIDNQFWIINRSKENNLHLYGSMPNSQVTININNPKFHSGCFVGETLVSSNCSKEQFDALCTNTELELS